MFADEVSRAGGLFLSLCIYYAICRSLRGVSLVGAFLCGWMYTFKVIEFQSLMYTSDLFTFVQHGTSWLEGRFLWDNHFGYHGNLHTFLLNPLFGLPAIPFGAYGLLSVLAAGYGLTFFFANQIGLIQGLSPRASTAFAVLLVLMPLTITVFRDPIYGFHPEILLLPLGLKLALSLMHERRGGLSLTLAAAMCLVKEDAPILTAAIGAGLWLRSALRGEWRREPALVVALSLLALPVLVEILSLQPFPVISDTYPEHSGPLAFFRLMGGPGASSEQGLVGLVIFVVRHLGDWLLSTVTLKYLTIMLSGSFLLALACLPILFAGAPLTVTSWLADSGSSLRWSPRLAPILAIAIIAAIMGAGALLPMAQRLGRPARAVLIAGVVAVCLGGQIAFVGATAIEFPLLQPGLRMPAPFTPEERRDADEGFASFRELSLGRTPVTATPWLQRYVHDRNVLWPNSLKGHPRPRYILYDTKWGPQFGLNLTGYEPIAVDGIFSLWRDTTTPARP